MFTWQEEAQEGGGRGGVRAASELRRQSPPCAAEDEPPALAARVPDPEGGAKGPGTPRLGPGQRGGGLEPAEPSAWERRAQRGG